MLAACAALLGAGAGSAGAADSAQDLQIPTFTLLSDNGVSLASLSDAQVLPSGTGIGTASGNGYRCLVLTHNDGHGEDGDCATPEEIASGDEMLVFDRCGQASGSRVVAVVVPPGVASVEFDRADGGTRRQSVADGTAAFEQSLKPFNPGVITKTRWLAADGSVIHEQPFLRGIPAGCAQGTASTAP